MADPAIEAALIRERERQYQREYYARNRERIAEQARARRAANPERARQAAADYREKNRYRIANQRREWHEEQKHGPAFKAWRQATWCAQDGRCYLCQWELGPELRAVVEHDHRCCPNNKSCEKCRRGLACDRCNNILGFAGDDPDVLELIARNLRPALDAVASRLAEQGS